MLLFQYPEDIDIFSKKMDFVVIINLKIHEKLHLKTCRTQIITVLPLEAQTFEHFSSKHFLVSSNST